MKMKKKMVQWLSVVLSGKLRSTLFLATDVNRAACRAAQTTAARHGTASLQV